MYDVVKWIRESTTAFCALDFIADMGLLYYFYYLQTAQLKHKTIIEETDASLFMENY